MKFFPFEKVMIAIVIALFLGAFFTYKNYKTSEKLMNHFMGSSHDIFSIE